MASVVMSSPSTGGPLSQTETPRVPFSARSEGGTKLDGGVTQVHAAAVNGDRQTLARLLAMIVAPDELDAGDQFGRSALMYCVLADRPECAELLIKAGALVNLKDKGGRTALHWAAHKGNLRLIKLLLTRGADCREKDNEGQTALHLCTRHKLSKIMALLLRQLTPGEIDDQDKNKRTALHWAASHGNLEHVKMLIKQNSNIGIPDTEGKTPLHWAASSRDREAVSCVKLVLETTPSVINWQDYEGRTALHLAVADGNESVVNVLTSIKNVNVVSALDNVFRTPLHWAAVLGHSKIVAILLDSGADSSSSDANGATALHYAAQNNFSETVSVFLHRQLVDEPDLEGRTAFMWAAGTGADDVIKAFFAAGVDIQQEDKTGGTALHVAALSGHASTVRLLLDNGARIEATDHSKHSPLFRACEMGHTDVVQTLVEYGARVDGLDQDGRSPLHWAALGGHAYICQMLIKYGDHPNVRDHSARAPLHCAAYGGFVNCMSALMEHGAEPNCQDREGMTCLHWACSKGHLDAVKLLVEYNAFPNHMEHTEDRYTPLDYALMGEHHEVAQYMIEQGALSITGIQDIAAQKIQCAFRGYRVRKAFIERKKLLMKHEKLKKEAARKRAAEEGKKVSDDKKLTPNLASPSKDYSSDGGQDVCFKQLTAKEESSIQPSSVASDQECVNSMHENQVTYNELSTDSRHKLEHDQPELQETEQSEAELTEALRRKRLKMRKSEERRRRLVADTSLDEEIKRPHQKDQQESQQLDDSSQLGHAKTTRVAAQYNEQSHSKEKSDNLDQSPQCNNRQSLKEESLERDNEPEELEPGRDRRRTKKHRSRSRRRRSSTSPSHQPRDVSTTESSTIMKSKTVGKTTSMSSTSTSSHGEKPLHEKQKEFDESEDKALNRNSRVPQLPLSPRKEQQQRPPVKYDSEDFHLPPSPRKEIITPQQSPRKQPEEIHLPPSPQKEQASHTQKRQPRKDICLPESPRKDQLSSQKGKRQSTEDISLPPSPRKEHTVFSSEKQSEKELSLPSSPRKEIPIIDSLTKETYSNQESAMKTSCKEHNLENSSDQQKGNNCHSFSTITPAQFSTDYQLPSKENALSHSKNRQTRSSSISPPPSPSQQTSQSSENSQGQSEHSCTRRKAHHHDHAENKNDQSLNVGQTEIQQPSVSSGKRERKKKHHRTKDNKDKQTENVADYQKSIKALEKSDKTKDLVVHKTDVYTSDADEKNKCTRLWSPVKDLYAPGDHLNQSKGAHKSELISQVVQDTHVKEDKSTPQQENQSSSHEEHIRQAQLRKQELSKRYQGERMHSSHREHRQRDDRMTSNHAPSSATAFSEIQKGLSSQQDKLFSSSFTVGHLGSRRKSPSKEPELNDQEKILASKSQTHNITLQERKRREDFQRKIAAASTIQRCWRRYQRIKTLRRNLNIGRVQHTAVIKDHCKEAIHKKRLQATQEEWEKQIAALTIQLAWRKFFRRKLLRALSPNRRQLLMWDPEVVALKQQALVQYIYNEHIEVPFWHPTLKPSVRPFWTRFMPSAAVISYNFAVDQYHPLVARSGIAPEFPPGYEPQLNSAEPTPLYQKSSSSGSQRTGSATRSAPRSATRRRHLAGSRLSGSEHMSEESNTRSRKASAGNKMKSAQFSYNMRKKL